MHRPAPLMHRPAPLMHRPAPLMHCPAPLMHCPAKINPPYITEQLSKTCVYTVDPCSRGGETKHSFGGVWFFGFNKQSSGHDIT